MKHALTRRGRLRARLFAGTLMLRSDVLLGALSFLGSRMSLRHKEAIEQTAPARDPKAGHLRIGNMIFLRRWR